MKISGYFRARDYYDDAARASVLYLYADNKGDARLLEKLIFAKRAREEKTGEEVLLRCSLELPSQNRTAKQNSTAFKIISLVFESQEGRKPTEGEKMSLYYDLLETHADKKPTRGGVRLRPVHLSEANTEQAARFIDGLLFELCTCCDLPRDLQADARQIIYEWENWRGQQTKDFTASMTEKEWRARAVYSEASGLGGDIELHHILPKGSHPQFADDPENWMALTHWEHREFHDLGRERFLQKYPHLAGRFERMELKAQEGKSE